MIRAATVSASAAFIVLASSISTAAEDGQIGFLREMDIDTHGFYEARVGYRTRNDPYEKDMSAGESRFQIDLDGHMENADLKFKADTIGDLVSEDVDLDIRESNIFLMPLDWADLKAGRQILTWGTGDLLFINDLFPKDWQSFFIGRDNEYLKAPSDAVKASFFTGAANLDVVYTPQFDPDRFINGRRLSYWNAAAGRTAGHDMRVHADIPNRWIRDGEIAARLYKTVKGYELALYGYSGFWKSPGGMDTLGRAIFPDLNVYGASARGPVAGGIGNIEVGYYDSADDRGGDDPAINNSEMRYLLGYTREIGRDFTAGAQYYIEQLMDYSDYRRSLTSSPTRDRLRHLVSVRLTKLLENQLLRLSLFAYYSPTDHDAHLRPNIHYKATDNLSFETGANIFFGRHAQTFFGQFKNNTNIYTAVRYSF